MYRVVPATGRGTRMRPLTDRHPKPLLPVGDRSLLDRVFDAALDTVDAVVVVVGYRSTALKETIGDQYRGQPVHYVDQATPPGTAHAILQPRPIVNERFIVLNGDVLIDPSLPQALAGIVEKPAAPPTSLANVGCYLCVTN